MGETKTKLLAVEGKKFCAGAIFEKVDGEWRIKDIAPYLKKVFGDTPVPELGNLLRKKGYKYKWYGV